MSFWVLVIFMSFTPLCTAQLGYSNFHKMLYKKFSVATSWHMESSYSDLKSLMESFSHKSVLNEKLSGQCSREFQQFLVDFQRNESYTTTVLDSYGKPGSGVTAGNIYWLGSFDLCRQVSVETSSSTRFDGKHCTLQLDQGINLGICIPDSCDVGDGVSVAKAIFPDLDVPQDQALTGYCYEDLPWTASDIVAAAILSFFALCSLIGTTYDAIIRQKGDKSYRRMGSVLLCFSWLKNGEKLFSTKSSSDQLACINGLRTLSMFWVILGHTAFQNFFYSQNMLSFTKDMVFSFEFQAILNADFAVDSFFFMSGLLVGYVTLKALANKPKPKFWALFYFHRFWRLTPVYMLCLMFFMTLFFHLLHGPLLTPFTTRFKTPCDYWWTNLLYINNFHPGRGQTSDTCFSWGWYLANDMQFYILSPCLLLLLRHYWKIGIAVSSALISACVITTGFLTKFYGVYNILLPTPDMKDGAYEMNSDMYVRPYFRFVPYVIGLVLGSILLKYREINLHWFAKWTGWILAFGFGLSVIYGYLPYVEAIFTANDFNKDVAYLYFTMRRFTWSIALAWLVFACMTGNGGPINWFLSWRIWIPFGRLSYCAYLVHPMVMYAYQLNLQVLLNMDTENIIFFFMSFLSLSYFVAAVVSLTLESPFMSIEKIVLGGITRMTKEKPPGGIVNGTNKNCLMPSYSNGGYHDNENDKKMPIKESFHEMKAENICKLEKDITERL